MSSSGLPGADASRPRSGILTPTSDGSLHRRHAARESSPGPLRGNASSTGAMDQLLNASIAVKPHPHDLHVKPRTLHPIMLLPRDQFALAHIDLGNPCGDLPLSRFFECRIKILELEGRMGTATSVVIARPEAKPNLYALERQPSGLYVVCKLGSWVDIHDLAQHATVVSEKELRPTDSIRKPSVSDAALSKPQIYKEHKQKRAAIEAIQSLVRKRPRSATSASLDVPIKSETSDPARPEDIDLSRATPQDSMGSTKTPAVASQLPGVISGRAEDEANPSAPPTSDAILETIRTQYFEALYKSMGSLAYFAKGPLSRARSTFHLDLDTNLDMSELIDFLKSMVLTTVQIDKKYRETLPEIIAKPLSHGDSSDEARKRRKRTKKMKLGKNGLYPSEDEMIQRWWASYKPEEREEEATVSATETRAHIAMLRTRETQLQMILILEILALEPLKAAEDATDSMLPELPGATQTPDSMAPPASKKRSKHNFPVLLDVHADRLTIWQSTAFDNPVWSTESQSSVAADSQPDKQASSEPLRDFCVDVIVPFFSARLPQQCDAINKKLGGPVIVSPPKSKSSKHSSNSKSQKPGSVAKRQVPTKQPRTLQRALSTDLQHRRSVSRGPSNALALLRSASSTAVTGVKREGSEPVVIGDSESSRQGHGILSRTSSSSNLAGAKNPRAEKKALVEAELKDAISALRKPNRDVVGKAMEEAAQHKLLSSKKLRKPNRSSMSAVQVEATPANNRFRDVLAARSDNIVDMPSASTEDVIPPSSVGHLVPSTGRKAMHDAAYSASPFGAAIGSTPVKTSASSNFLRRSGDDFAIPPSSPLIGRKQAPIQQRLSGSTSGMTSKGGFGLSQSRDISIFMTPIKKAPAAIDVAAVENIGPSPMPEVKKTSIYDKLGWDDDFDDL